MPDKSKGLSVNKLAYKISDTNEIKIDDTQKNKIAHLYFAYQSHFQAFGITSFEAYLNWLQYPISGQAMMNLTKTIALHQLKELSEELTRGGLDLRERLAVQRLMKGINKDVLKIASLDYYLNPPSIKTLNPEKLFSKEEVKELDKKHPLPEKETVPDAPSDLSETERLSELQKIIDQMESLTSPKSPELSVESLLKNSF